MSPAAAPSACSSNLDAARRDLDRLGYCVVADVLTPTEIVSLKARLAEQAEGERARGVAFHDGGPDRPNPRVWMLLNKGKVFRDLMLHPIVEALMGHLLGPDFLLSSFTANITHPGGEPTPLHTDQGYVGFWTPKPVVVNIAWMLDDFADANGVTRLVPASRLNYHCRRVGPKRKGLSAKHIREACEASLKRLNTDYIDLYQMHHKIFPGPGGPAPEAYAW